MLLIPFLLVWFFKEFYNDKPLKSVILRVLAIIGLLILFFIIIMIIVFVGAIIYTVINGPEAMKQFAPKAK
jgi:predicted membrane protein